MNIFEIRLLINLKKLIFLSEYPRHNENDERTKNIWHPSWPKEGITLSQNGSAKRCVEWTKTTISIAIPLKKYTDSILLFDVVKVEILITFWKSIFYTFYHKKYIKANMISRNFEIFKE